MGSFDSFTLAVLGSALAVIVIFVVMMLVDKGKVAVPPPAGAPAKVAGKR